MTHLATSQALTASVRELCLNTRFQLTAQEISELIPQLCDTAYALSQTVRQLGNQSPCAETQHRLDLASSTAWNLGQHLDAAYQTQC